MLIVAFILLQIIAFGAVIFALKKILHSDTQGAVRRLEGAYQDLVKKQKDLQQKIEVAEKEYAEKKEESIKIAEKMKSEAMDEMRNKRDDVIKAAKAQADEILSKARASTEEHYRKVEMEVNRKMIDMAAGLIHSSLSPKTAEVLNECLVKEFLDTIKGIDLSSVGPHVESLTLRTVAPLSKENLDKLNSIILTKMKRAIKVEEVTDSQVLAGILLQFGTLLLDGSLPNYVRDNAEKAKADVQFQSKPT